MRIEQHPIFGEVKRGKKISFIFDGQPVEAFEGETIAAALWAADIKTARYTAKKARAARCVLRDRVLQRLHDDRGRRSQYTFVCDTGA